MSKEAYTAAVEFFISTASQIRDDQWDAPALGVWVVRDLVGHTARSITRVEEFGANRAETVDIESAAHHYRTSLSRSGVDAQIAQARTHCGRSARRRPAQRHPRQLGARQASRRRRRHRYDHRLRQRRHQVRPLPRNEGSRTHRPHARPGQRHRPGDGTST